MNNEAIKKIRDYVRVTVYADVRTSSPTVGTYLPDEYTQICIWVNIGADIYSTIQGECKNAVR